MFEKNSLTIAGLVALILGFIAKSLGADSPDETAIADVIGTIMQVIGLLSAYVGRVRQGDIDWLGRKKAN